METEANGKSPLMVTGQKLGMSQPKGSTRLQSLQEKLYQKARQEPKYRFYILYDKLTVSYVLSEAWRKVRSKNSAAGVDNLRVSDIIKQGETAYLEQIRQELKSETYRPQPIKRIYVPKANGKERPIGIACVRDRIVQTAMKFILEPIFETDFSTHSYGFRPGISAEGAIREIKDELRAGKTEVYDADLSSYFDTIPHNKLYATMKLRIADTRIMKLLDKFLKVPIKEDKILKGGKKNKIGVPQGGIISTLLANIYMNLIDKAVERTDGIFTQSQISIVRYADDFVLMGKEITQASKTYLKELFNRMELTINEEKTHIVEATLESFNFLGFTFRYDKDLYGGYHKYWNVIPSKQSISKLKANITEYLGRSLHVGPIEVVEKLNEKIRGWLNYYDIKGVSYAAQAKRSLRYFLVWKLYRFYNRKSQRKCTRFGRNVFEGLVQKYRLIDPVKYISKTLDKEQFDELFRKAVCGKTARTV